MAYMLGVDYKVDSAMHRGTQATSVFLSACKTVYGTRDSCLSLVRSMTIGKHWFDSPYGHGLNTGHFMRVRKISPPM